MAEAYASYPRESETHTRRLASAEAVPHPSPQSITAGQESQRIDVFINSMKNAAYAFNPPSPIKVNKPVTIYLWLDPLSSPQALREQLQRQVPEDAARTEAGISRWSPVMEAALGGDEFIITPITPTRQAVSSKERTEWRWSITPKHPGRKERLHITLNAVMPDGLRSVTAVEIAIEEDEEAALAYIAVNSKGV